MGTGRMEELKDVHKRLILLCINIHEDTLVRQEASDVRLRGGLGPPGSTRTLCMTGPAPSSPGQAPTPHALAGRSTGQTAASQWSPT